MSSKASQMHFALILLKGAEEAWGIGLIGQRLPSCVQPAIDWFLRKFNVQLWNTVSAFKAARYMCSVSVQWLKPTQQSVEALRIFPFLDDDGIINGLKAELPAYLAATEDVVINTEERKVDLWHNHKDQLPHWASAVKKVLLVQPSSAVAERVFSILNSIDRYILLLKNVTENLKNVIFYV